MFPVDITAMVAAAALVFGAGGAAMLPRFRKRPAETLDASSDASDSEERAPLRGEEAED